MVNIMTQRGNLDNIVRYEHVCDKTADLENVPYEYRTLGSTAIVIQGDSGGIQVYIADSNHKWHLLSLGGGGNSSDIPSQDNSDEVDVGKADSMILNS